MDALQTLFRAPLTLGVHPNIAYDMALVKLGPHAKFGEDWSNGVYFYTGHTHTHTHTHTQTQIHRLDYLQVLKQLSFSFRIVCPVYTFSAKTQVSDHVTTGYSVCHNWTDRVCHSLFRTIVFQ